jgi:hypothetical protein
MAQKEGVGAHRLLLQAQMMCVVQSRGAVVTVWLCLCNVQLDAKKKGVGAE